ncbi:uncharacterized protein LOC143891135 [Tasmannia lanceolata]|uniref:uncharacterized protein LOC143891135 n=1 Tax=Tasmannia lanceolata TaxID=3420 RepID=UPI004064C752
MTPPRTEKQIRGFLGKVQYLRRFIAQLTTICEQIFKLLKKNAWDEECQQAFEKIKLCLTSPPVLSPITPSQPLLLYLSVTNTAMGCMLAQQDPESKREKAVYYLSKKMLEYEQKYTLLEKTCLALKSIKGRVVAEQLAEVPVEEVEYLKTEFPDEEIMIVEDEAPGATWSRYFDGAVNKQGRGIGAVLVSPRKEYTPISIKLQFECTNNMTEYEACIVGLEAALVLNIQDIDVFGDSILIICQTKGCWRTREDKLIPYHEYLGSLVSKFRNISFTHLPRVKNHFAGALATLASMLELSGTMEVQPLAVRLQWAPTHVNVIEIAARWPDGKPWYTDIKDLISGKGHLAEASGKERRTLQRLASNFIICGG